MSEGGWLWIDSQTRIRRLPDGQYLGQRIVPVAEDLAMNAAVRANNTSSTRGLQTWDGGLAKARVPEGYAGDMLVQTRADPELRKAYLRDHPELLLGTRRQMGIPTLRPIVIPIGSGHRKAK